MKHVSITAIVDRTSGLEGRRVDAQSVQFEQHPLKAMPSTPLGAFVGPPVTDDNQVPQRQSGHGCCDAPATRSGLVMPVNFELRT